LITEEIFATAVVNKNVVSLDFHTFKLAFKIRLPDKIYKI